MTPPSEDPRDAATLGGLAPRQTRPYGSPPYHVPLWGDSRARDFAEELLASTDVPMELVQLALHVMRSTPAPRPPCDGARQVLPGSELRRPSVPDVASRRTTFELDGPEICTLREISSPPARKAPELRESPRAVIAAFLLLDHDGRHQVMQILKRVEELEGAEVKP